VRGLSNIVEKYPPIAALLGPFCSDGSRLSIWNPILNRWQIWAPETDRLWLGPREAERDDALAFRSDGKAVFATADTGIVEFEFESQSYAKRYATPFRPAVLIASGDGGRLAIGDGTRRHLAVLDSHNGDSLFVREMPAGAEYWTLMLSDNGFWLAASARDFTVHAWPIDGEVQTGLTLKGHQAEVAGLAFDPNCEHLITSSWDGTTRWWSIATGQIEIREETWGSPLRIGLDGRRVARLTTIGTNGACARLQTIERSEVYRCFGEPVPRGNLDLQKGPWHVDFLEDGRFLATASYDGVRIWDAFRGDPLAHLPLEAGFSALWLKAKRSVVTTGGGRLETWPMRTNRDGGFILGPRELVATGSDALYTASALDGRRLFARIGVEVAGFESDARWTAARAPYIRFAASPDGRWLVGSEYHSSDAALTDANTGIIVRRFPANVLAGAAFQPDGKRVIISCRDEISSLSVPEGSVLWRSPRQDASAGGPIAIDGEGRMIAAGITTRRLALLDATDGRILAEFTPPTPEPLTWIAFSPDGGNLAATTTSHITHLWDLRALRKALAGMGLDWNEPAQLPATAMPPATKIQITLTGASAKREADSPMPR
jgi:WD40 repeat protein